MTILKSFSDRESNVYLIVGLGNPGPGYSKNRHNLGFMVVDKMAEDKGLSWKSVKGVYETTEVRESGIALHLLKPMTFMNLSGKAVAHFASKKFIDYNNVIVVHDDLDLNFGKIRLKRGGGDGGHRGIRSIADSLRFKDFIRIRMGVGRPPDGVPAEVYVLSDFTEQIERENIEQLIDRGVFAIITSISEGIEKAQQKVSQMTPALDRIDR